MPSFLMFECNLAQTFETALGHFEYHFIPIKMSRRATAMWWKMPTLQ